jgi:methionine-rich copper-binding protein CopC
VAYHVLIDSTAIVDTSGGHAFAGISSHSIWNFTTALPTFSSWISTPAFGLVVADQDLYDDPDGDGIENGVENFFGTHPSTFSQGLVAGSRNGITFTFTHPQGTPASTSLQVTAGPPISPPFTPAVHKRWNHRELHHPGGHPLTRHHHRHRHHHGNGRQQTVRPRECGPTLNRMRRHLSLLFTLCLIAALSLQAVAQITVINTGSAVSPVTDDSKTAVLSFNAGAGANKLIVQVSAEGQEVDSITYQGVALTPAVVGAGSARNKGVFYLDNPFTGSAANLSVTLGVGTSNGIAVGVVSVSGAAPGVAAVASADAASSVTLTVPVSGSFVVSGYASNNTVGTITLPAGHTAMYNSTNIGSAHAAASYANGQSAGSRTYSYADTSPSTPATSAAVFVPASAAPVITGTSPADNALAVPPDADLVATFSEAVVAGSGTIQLWQSGGTSPLESFNVATSPQIAIAGSTVTIDPSANLAANTAYYVLITSSAVLDTSGGNAFAGYTSASTWSFSTGNTPPLVPTFSPKDEAFGVALNANLVATFSETIQKGTGNITIRRTDGTVFETINVTSAAVTLSGGKVTINPANNFVAGAGYYVLIDPTALRNTTSQYYAGISDPTVWNFSALPDLATVDGRLTRMMQNNITNPYPSTTSSAGLASYALAAFYLGTDLVTANNYIEQYHNLYPVPDSDTIDFDSYFWLHLIWRIYHDPAMNARLTPQARADILDMMWLFIRTRSSTSNAQGDTWVYHGSENHDAMQKGSYLLCAEALKDAPGYGPNMVLADGQTLAQHATAWSGYFQRYFVARAGEGINAEIASPIYAKYSVGVYYNVMDFAESPVLRTLAQRFITLYWADTASDWTLSGVRGGGRRAATRTATSVSAASTPSTRCSMAMAGMPLPVRSAPMA